MPKEAKIMIVVFILIFGGLGYLIARNNRLATTPITKSQLITATSHSKGNTNAKVNLVEFGDFQCPACAAAYPIIEEVLAMYKDNPQVNFVFRNFPLTTVHQYALLSAEAVEAAGAQGKYWEMYGLVYKNQGAWSASNDPLSLFVGYATQLGLDVNKFKFEVQANKYNDVISSDQQAGLALGINSTPTFFLNGIRMTGVRDVNDFKSRIDSALAE
ncbi:MAG: thioredoxin domain-containing protein [Patescibacteria group bacterium]